jgi:hypothetical protein
MGIRGLYTYLKHYKNEISLKGFKDPLRIGIDAMSFLYRYKNNNEDILQVLRALKEVHRIFFVFDGKPPAEKGDEIRARKETKESSAAKASTLELFLQSDSAKEIDTSARQLLEDSLQRCQTKSWHASRTVRRAFQDVLWDEEIPYAKSMSEADDVLIDLYKAGKLDVILSSDMDYLAAGVERLWIPSHKGIFWAEEIILTDVLVGEDLTIEHFMDVGAICGVAPHLPCQTVFTWLRHYGSIEAILASTLRTSMTLAAVQQARERFKACPAYSRIRPDHLERVVLFLETL